MQTHFFKQLLLIIKGKSHKRLYKQPFRFYFARKGAVGPQASASHCDSCASCYKTASFVNVLSAVWMNSVQTDACNPNVGNLIVSYKRIEIVLVLLHYR